MSQSETQRWADSLSTTQLRLQLTRVSALLAALGNPQHGLPCVHIAGTNGKGSTAACLTSILRAAGYRVGLFTSPALEAPGERIQVDGLPLSPTQTEELQALIHTAAMAMEDTPTEFEVTTVMALLHFARSGCDLAVLEVGLGGAGDATNVIDPPEVAVFAAMGLDHTGILGHTLREIAAVKAGILKAGARAVSYGNSPEAEAVFSQRCAQLGVPFTRMNQNRLGPVSVGLEGCSFTLSPYGPIKLPLLGSYQPKNALLAVTAAEELRCRGWEIPNSAIVNGLATVEWPGRCQLLLREPVFLLDGSHNPQGLAATLDSLAQLLPRARWIFLVSIMADKAVEEMAALLAPAAAEFIAVQADNPRAMDAETLSALLGAQGVPSQAAPSIPAGVALALSRARETGHPVCALGTLYFSGDVRKAVEHDS